MTAQVNDSFVFDNISYSVSAVESPKTFFNILSLGIKPVGPDTSCKRGYVAIFSINNEKLVLNSLFTNNGFQIENEAPLINGKLPKISIPKDYNDTTWWEFTYEDINLIMNYTGSILITKDFIDDMYVHLGFQSPISYNIVIQLIFNDGNLISSKDLSDIAALMRKGKTKTAKKKMKEKNIVQWIDDCFRGNKSGLVYQNPYLLQKWKK
jgi:hypothetical protein